MNDKLYISSGKIMTMRIHRPLTLFLVKLIENGHGIGVLFNVPLLTKVWENQIWPQTGNDTFVWEEPDHF